MRSPSTGSVVGMAAATGGKPKRLSRADRNNRTKMMLIEAAAAIVGKYGFEKASIARVTERIGIAQGTFYNHFSSRQELLDLLLPMLTRDMMAAIARELKSAQTHLEQEIARLRAYLRYISEYPGFARVLHEAEFYSPKRYREHLDHMHRQYCRALETALAPSGYTEAQIDLIGSMLLGIRSKLIRTLMATKRKDVDATIDKMVEAYRMILIDNLFR